MIMIFVLPKNESMRNAGYTQNSFISSALPLGINHIYVPDSPSGKLSRVSNISELCILSHFCLHNILLPG